MSQKLELADYRRKVAELYAAVRQASDPALAREEWRVDRDALFATHSQSPIRADERSRFTGSAFFDYDADWRVLADVEPVEEGAALLGHSGDGKTRYVRIGIVRTEYLGKPFSLDVYWLDSYGGGLFLPFRDATNGSSTYGGGRYLLDGAKGADLGTADGRLVLDFNFAYHPSCVWDDRWSCPLPPPANRIEIPVTAGERLG